MSRSKQFSRLSFSHPIFFPFLSTHPLSHLLFHPSALFSLLMSFPLLSSMTLILISTFHPLLCVSFVCFFFSLSLSLLNFLLPFVSTLSSLAYFSFSSYSLNVCPPFLLPSLSLLLSLSLSALTFSPTSSTSLSLTPALSLPFWVLWLGCWHFHWDVYMTTEITHSLICSLSISPPAVSSFSLTSAHFLPLSSLIFVFSFYPLPVLLSASPSFYFRSLSLCLSTSFLYLLSFPPLNFLCRFRRSFV